MRGCYEEEGRRDEDGDVRYDVGLRCDIDEMPFVAALDFRVVTGCLIQLFTGNNSPEYNRSFSRTAIAAAQRFIVT